MPNGVILSPDEKTLYVGDSSRGRWIWAYTVNEDNSLSDLRKFVQNFPAIPDGFAMP